LSGFESLSKQMKPLESGKRRQYFLYRCSDLRGHFFRSHSGSFVSWLQRCTSRASGEVLQTFPRTVIALQCSVLETTGNINLNGTAFILKDRQSFLHNKAVLIFRETNCSFEVVICPVIQPINISILHEKHDIAVVIYAKWNC